MDSTSPKQKCRNKNKLFRKIFDKFKKKPNLIETHSGREFYVSTFENFLNKNNIKHFSRNTFSGAVFAEGFNRTVRDLFTRPIVEKSDGNWIDVLSAITKRYFSRIHSSTKLTPIRANLKKNEGFAHNNLLDKRKKINSKFQVNDLVRTTDSKKTFSKGDTTNWSYEIYKITKKIFDTRPSYKIESLIEKYNEALLKKTELTTKEKDSVMKKLKF